MTIELSKNYFEGIKNIHTGMIFIKNEQTKHIYFNFMLFRFLRDSDDYLSACYCIEWANRFNNDDVSIFMDEKSQFIYKKILQFIGGNNE